MVTCERETSAEIDLKMSNGTEEVFLKLLTFLIACPSTFTLASVSSGFFPKTMVFVFAMLLHLFHIVHFVDCILQFLIAIQFNNINVASKSEVVHSITMNTYSTVFSILDFIHYSVQEQSK